LRHITNRNPKDFVSFSLPSCMYRILWGFSLVASDPYPQKRLETKKKKLNNWRFCVVVLPTLPF
jgi:hypothetical protein